MEHFFSDKIRMKKKRIWPTLNKTEKTDKSCRLLKTFFFLLLNEKYWG